jgi:KDO2-lipid IV(A) lauroyltransferase
LVRFKKEFNVSVPEFVNVEGLEHFDRAYKRGKGVFGVTGHLGNYEILAVYLAKLGYRVGVISRPLADNRLNELLVRNRERMGVTNFYASDNPLAVVRWLGSGGAIGVLIDTDSSRVRGEFIPFFGRMAKVPVGQTVIALRTGAALVPLYCARLTRNRYKVIIRPEIPINVGNYHERDIFRITEQCNYELETQIRRYPDQWIWMHNRWKSSPEHFSS